jgi:4-hydroxybenzoate polyprenyltransferase
MLRTESAAMSYESQSGNHAVPLCVDLDGTLLKTDLLWESLLSNARLCPWVLLSLPLWLIKGRAVVKARLAERANIDFGSLPYREEVIAFIRERRKDGQPTFLTTASTARLAAGVAANLDLFDGVIASDHTHNMKGAAKAGALVTKFGHGRFDYVGDSRADLPVWQAARNAFSVGDFVDSTSASKCSKVIRSIASTVAPLRKFDALVRALRPHQWAKNLLLLVPLLASHRIGEMSSTLDTLLAFVAFCLCASSAYVLNDLLDLEADRSHPRKRTRPLASGDLPLIAGVVLGPALLLSATGLALLLSPMFQATLALYYVGTIMYSVVLKQRVMVDVIALAGLYTVRILAGGYAIAAPVSFWLLGFSMFIFLSLALVKRYTEFFFNDLIAGKQLERRGYALEDKQVVLGLGSASGMVAILVLALYINSDSVSALYRHPARLWLICPILLYWIGRVWIIAGRGKMHDDPVVFATRDRMSYIVALALAIVVWSAA